MQKSTGEHRMPQNQDMAKAMDDKISGLEEEKRPSEGFAGHVDTSEIKLIDFSTMPKQSGKFSKQNTRVI